MELNYQNSLTDPKLIVSHLRQLLSPEAAIRDPALAFFNTWIANSPTTLLDLFTRLICHCRKPKSASTNQELLIGPQRTMALVICQRLLNFYKNKESRKHQQHAIPGMPVSQSFLVCQQFLDEFLNHGFDVSDTKLMFSILLTLIQLSEDVLKFHMVRECYENIHTPLYLYLLYRLLDSSEVPQEKFSYIDVSALKKLAPTSETRSFLIKMLIVYSDPSENRPGSLTHRECFMIYQDDKKEVLDYLAAIAKRLQVSQIVQVLHFVRANCFQSFQQIYHSDEAWEFIERLAKLLNKYLTVYVERNLMSEDTGPGQSISSADLTLLTEWTLHNLIRFAKENDEMKFLLTGVLLSLSFPIVSPLLNSCVKYLMEIAFTPSPPLGNEQNYLDRRRGNTFYLLSLLIRELPKETDGDELAKLIMKELQKKKISYAVPMLQFIKVYLEKLVRQNSRIKHDIWNCITYDRLNNVETVEEFEVIVSIVFKYPKEISENFLCDLLNVIQGFDSFEMTQMFEALGKQLAKPENISEDVHSFIHNVFTNYQDYQLCLKCQYLYIYANIIAASCEDMKIVDFLDHCIVAYKIEPKETLQLERHCMLVKELVAVENEHNYFSQTFIEYIEKYLQVCLEKDCEYVYYLLMEMADLNTRYTRLLDSLKKYLVKRVPQKNPKFLDILEFFLILYPKSMKSYSSEILTPLVGTMEYYRFYLRLQPDWNLPPFPQELKSVTQIKWGILAVISWLKRNNDDQIKIAKEDTLDSLALQMTGLSLGKNQRQQVLGLINRLARMQDDQEPWFGKWYTGKCSKIFRRDYQRWTKEAILNKHRNYFESDILDY